MAKNPFTRLTYEWIMALAVVGLATCIVIVIGLLKIGLEKIFFGG